MRLSAHGLAIELPPRWSGRIFRSHGGGPTLHAGDFPLVLRDGQFGDASTARMPPGASFIALTEYLPGAGLIPGRGLFAPRRIALPLEPTAFHTRGLAHPHPGQVGSQQFFTAGGRPFCVYMVLSAGVQPRRRQLALLGGVLSTLRIEPAGGGGGSDPV